MSNIIKTNITLSDYPLTDLGSLFIDLSNNQTINRAKVFVSSVRVNTKPQSDIGGYAASTEFLLNAINSAKNNIFNPINVKRDAGVTSLSISIPPNGTYLVTLDSAVEGGTSVYMLFLAELIAFNRNSVEAA